MLHDGTVQGLAKVAGLSDDWPPAAAPRALLWGWGGEFMGDFCQAVWYCSGALNGVSSNKV